MTFQSKVLVIAGGVAVVVVGATVIAITSPALAVQATASAATYVIANGCIIIKQALSGLFSAGALWFLWDYFCPASSCCPYSEGHKYRHESYASGLGSMQAYDVWQPENIALASRRSSFQSSSHRGRPRHQRSNSAVSLLSEFSLELPASVFNTPRPSALAGTPFSLNAQSRANSPARSSMTTSSGVASPASIWTLDGTTQIESFGVTTIIDEYIQRGLRHRVSGV
ncbi:hypothetical protein FBU30_008934 [Linnemannia zychae]|nr:hypothetical protein FBU30_008934 [Linnemannia zychae]